MLHISAFQEATIDVRLKEVKDHGDFILKTEENNKLIRLYQYNRYFVELIYTLEFGTLKEIKAITVLEAAEKYVTLDGMLD